ncbi:Lysophospholipase 1, partial [Borealophlyctis nickersoniae]
TSSSLFNAILTSLGTQSSLLSPITSDIAESGHDTALVPNPFHALPSVNDSVSTPDWLELVDGGESGQNVPLYPLIQSARGVDVIFAVDSSRDMDDEAGGWPNGTSLLLARWYAQRHNLSERVPELPETPDAFVKQGLHQRVTVFGCGSRRSNGSAETNYTGPMIVYIPNRYVTDYTNTSTYKMDYNSTDVDAFFRNSAALMSDPMGNGTTNNGAGSDWNKCLACIVAAPTFRSNTTTVPERCKNCFDKYCWDGSKVGEVQGMSGPPVVWGWNGTGEPPVIPYGNPTSSATGSPTAPPGLAAKSGALRARGVVGMGILAGVVAALL